MLPILKGTFYRVGGDLHYSMEQSVGQNAHPQKMKVVEIKMRMDVSHTRRDKIRNKVMHDKVRVAFETNKMRGGK